MSKVDEQLMEEIFKAVQAFPNDIRIASLTQDCKAIVKDLERQLAEARELVFTAYQEGWNDNRNNLDCWETHWIDSDSRYSLEQLKEKGDE